MKRKLIFPCIMATIFFLLFIALYLGVIFYSIHQYFLLGLIFAIPFIVYILIAISAYKGKKVRLLSFLVIPVLIFYLLFSFFIFAILDTSSTNERYYSRALKFSDYSNNNQIDDRIRYFPNTIPENAKDIDFEYSSFMDIWLFLEFKTDQESISNYEQDASASYIWKGTISDIGKRYGNKSILSPKHLSNDAIIYILYDSYDDIFEAVCCYYIAIDNQNNRVTFCYYHW